MAAGDSKLVTQGILAYYHNKVTAKNGSTYAKKEDVPTAETVVQMLVESGATMTESDVDAMFADETAPEGDEGA
jgi:hypothetical protein